jgi:hypothetical protein
MRSALVMVLVLAATPAFAKPLPPGLKVTFAKDKLTATQDGVSITLTTVKAKKLVSAELSEDGSKLQIKLDGIKPVENEIGEVEEDDGRREYALTAVEAQLANTAGMGLSIKKKYADAITHFARAVQKEPAPVYITNLLSAQSLAGKLDDADAVIAAHGKRIAPWLAWRLVVDGDLKALAARPSVKLGMAGTGKARSKLDEQVAYSSLGFAASEIVTNASMGDGRGPTERGLAFVDLKTGKQVLLLPTETTCEDKACTKKYAPAALKQRAVADKVLAMLDFEQVAGGYHSAIDKDVVAAKDGRKIDFKASTIVIPGKKPLPLPPELPEAWGVAFVPKAVVFVTRERNGDVFDIGLTSIATP